MLDWTELIVFTGISIYFIGSRDLPRVSNLVGTQIGRIVGFMQGAKIKADEFASKNELRQLQHELRMGLRELDIIRSEMTHSISPTSRGGGGLMGGGQTNTPLGTTTTTNNNNKYISAGAGAGVSAAAAAVGGGASSAGVGMMGRSNYNATMSPHLPVATATTSSSLADATNNSTTTTPTTTTKDDYVLAPANQTMLAVAEEEWTRLGISYRSRAEGGYNDRTSSSSSLSSSSNGVGGVGVGGVGGSIALAHLIQQSLIHDQYDRIMLEQDQALQSKVHTIQQKIQKEKQQQEQKKEEEQEEQKEDSEEVTTSSSSTETSTPTINRKN